MSLDTNAILGAVASHAMALGQFERFTRHEPKNPPGSGLSVAFWVQSAAPLALASGLAATSARLEITCRFYQPMLTEPQDEIDPAIMAAVDALFTALSGDFELGGLVRDVDLLGAHGVGLSAQAGYQTIDRTMYRVMTIVIPLVVNDAWEQAP